MTALHDASSGIGMNPEKDYPFPAGLALAASSDFLNSARKGDCDESTGHKRAPL